MNIFIIEKCPIKAAQSQCDKHVVKMCTESAQMLCTAHRMLDGIETKRRSISGKRLVRYYVHPEYEDVLMKAVHFNHPCSVWTRETNNNYNWHFVHWKALCDEYTYRYGKVHKSWRDLSGILEAHPRNITIGYLKPRPFAISDAVPIDHSNPVETYRRFYETKQNNFAMLWQKGRPRPEWFNELNSTL